MDLSFVGEQLDEKAFTDVDEFASDVILMLDNCRTFNQDGTEFFKAADRLQVFDNCPRQAGRALTALLG